MLLYQRKKVNHISNSASKTIPAQISVEPGQNHLHCLHCIQAVPDCQSSYIILKRKNGGYPQMCSDFFTSM